MCCRIWRQVEPRNYPCLITPFALIQSFIVAHVAQLSGLRAVVERCAHLLRTSNFSSLAPALRRDSSLGVVRRMVELLQTTHRPGRGELVAIDGMALTLPSTLRHHCAKSNRNTVGGGVVWAYMVEAKRAFCPVQVLKVIRGAWHDTTIMREVALIAHGPIYLMDRGFYCFELLARWLDEGVHFIMRARARSLKYTVIRKLSAPRKIGSLQLKVDALVKLGGPTAKLHPRLRLLEATLPGGERLILVTDRLQWSAQRLLDAYKKRWHIERFHKFLKSTIGLAHLYSFSQTGLEFLLYTALLLALLLLLSQDADGTTLDLLRRALREERARLGLSTLWQRNACTTPRPRRKPARKRLKTVIQ